MSVDERETISIEKTPSKITWLTLNRPEKRNAMNPTMHTEMLQALGELAYDPETQVLILTGAGSAFCAGQDLKEFFRDNESDPGAMAATNWASQEWRLRRLSTFPKLTICMVNGWLCGGAFTQLISCDFAFAAEEAKFCLSEINFGALPGGLVTKVIADALRWRDALYYILTGDAFDGREAKEMGLVNKVFPLADLKRETTKFAEYMLTKNPAAVRASKEAYRATRTMDYQQAEDYLQAKTDQLRLLDPEGGWDKGMSGFLTEKSYKPGLGAYAR